MGFKTFSDSWGSRSATERDGGLDLIYWHKGQAVARIERFRRRGPCYLNDLTGRCAAIPTLKRAKELAIERAKKRELH